MLEPSDVFELCLFVNTSSSLDFFRFPNFGLFGLLTPYIFFEVESFFDFFIF